MALLDTRPLVPSPPIGRRSPARGDLYEGDAQTHLLRMDALLAVLYGGKLTSVSKLDVAGWSFPV